MFRTSLMSVRKNTTFSDLCVKVIIANLLNRFCWAYNPAFYFLITAEPLIPGFTRLCSLCPFFFPDMSMRQPGIISGKLAAGFCVLD